jgi:hypothetical protein
MPRLGRILRRGVPSSYECRYCGVSFIWRPGKPGYVDECPQCLHEKTIPKQKREPKFVLTPEAEQRINQLVRATKTFRRQMTKAGFSQEKIDRLIRQSFEAP